MSTAFVRFYAELNDFLAEGDRFRTIERRFDVPPSVKDLIEGIGVPHTEVDLVVVKGHSVEFSHRVANGDRIAVYPVFESVDVSADVRVRPAPLRVTRFAVDANLGKLARRLRLLGFDACYDAGMDDAMLVEKSEREGRVVLTRDVGLLKRRDVTRGYFVRSEAADEQAIEVVRRFDLAGSMRPLERCIECNGSLRPVAKEEVAHLLEEDTRGAFDEFRRCENCRRIYWRGSHYERMMAFVERVGRAVRVSSSA